MSQAEKQREHILRIITEEYPNGVMPTELRARMQHSGRAYTLGVVQAAVASLRAQRRVVWNDDSHTLHAANPADVPSLEDLDQGADTSGSYAAPPRSRPRRANLWGV